MLLHYAYAFTQALREASCNARCTFDIEYTQGLSMRYIQNKQAELRFYNFFPQSMQT